MKGKATTRQAWVYLNVLPSSHRQTGKYGNILHLQVVYNMSERMNRKVFNLYSVSTRVWRF